MTGADHDRPAAEGIAPGHFPGPSVQAGHVEPAPRRVRALLGGEWVCDSTRALYVWEHPYYPQLYLPAADVATRLLVDDDRTETTDQGEVALRTLRAGGCERPGGARLLTAPTDPTLADTYRFEWSALDHWFEEDEEIFVHPRNPFVRVDALRSSRPVRVELGGTVLALAPGCVVVFETGLPPRYYLEKTAIDWRRLEATDSVTECPYKGTTTRWWTARVGDVVAEDVAWGYDFPTRQVQPIAGLVAFDDEQVDLVVGDTEPRRG